MSVLNGLLAPFNLEGLIDAYIMECACNNSYSSLASTLAKL